MLWKPGETSPGKHQVRASADGQSPPAPRPGWGLASGAARDDLHTQVGKEGLGALAEFGAEQAAPCSVGCRQVTWTDGFSLHPIN